MLKPKQHFIKGERERVKKRGCVRGRERELMIDLFWRLHRGLGPKITSVY